MLLATGAAADTLTWHRAAYYDASYPSAWVGGTAVRDALAAAGYEVLNAAQLKQWMDARIIDGRLSTVVFTQDIVPDTVAESQSASATIRRYLNKGGKVVWYGDIPLYYQGHNNGTRTTWGVGGSSTVLGFNAAGGTWDVNQPVTITADGSTWGLQQTWSSVRPALPAGLRVLARDTSNNAAAWVRHYGAKDTFRGFVRFFDRAGTPPIGDVRALAEYAPAVLVGDNLMDDIVATFHYPWYGNPATSGRWVHWNDAGHSPPLTWTANYLPSYPDSAWNPAVQLYDCNDINLLRWQDRLMAYTGIDIAVASWWGIGSFADGAFARAVRTAKSVRWCIYYELDSVGDPTPQKIHDDLKYVIDTYGPTRNYAKIDDKWLVTVYAVSGSAAADRWRQAKAMLAAEGYPVYLNGDVGSPTAATAPDPWDAVHRYNPVAYQTLTAVPAGADDSGSTSPGFWLIGETPRLARSLSSYTASWNNAADNREKWRFHFLETWSEWHEGTQIEPGQEIVPDPGGFTPAGYDYGTTFLDAIAPRAHVLRWQSVGHRPIAPTRLEAETMVWEPDTSAEGAAAWRISRNGARIGSGIELPESQADLWLVVRARGEQIGSAAAWPTLVAYLDDAPVGEWLVDSSAYRDYSTSLTISAGVHRLELTLANDPGGLRDVDLVIDFAEVYAGGPDGDFDADGVVDAEDNCPTLANTDQADEDADGVGDVCDSCPATLPGAAVDAFGCPALIWGDFDRDGDVDQTDFGRFQACLTGSGSLHLAGCGEADFNGDQVVNQSDFLALQRCYSGPNHPADPGCMD